jgi:hypothetical protein
MGAWAVLYKGSSTDPTHRAGAVFALSVGAFIVGLGSSALWFPWMLFIFALSFPYVPSVFGPVVILHALLFRSYAHDLAGGSAARSIRLGTTVLLVVAFIALTGQAFLGLAGPVFLVTWWTLPLAREVLAWLVFPLPAGLTGIGYALVFRGWSVHARGSRDAAYDERRPQPEG